MPSSRLNLFSFLAATVVVTLSFLTQATEAACLTASEVVNCDTFSTDSPSSVILKYKDGSLRDTRFFQLRVRSSPTFEYPLTNLSYSFNGLVFKPFTNGMTVLPSGSKFAVSDSPVQDVHKMLTAPFYVAFNLPPGIPAEVTFDIGFLAKTDGATDPATGLLAEGDDIENVFVQFPRVLKSV